MPVATTTKAGREVLTPEAEKILNDRERARQNRLRAAAARADTLTPLGATKPAFETETLPDPPAAPAERTARPITMQIAAVLNGFTVQISFDGTLQQLPGAIERLRALGAEPTGNTPAAPLAASDDLPDGWKLCRKHGAPMRPRNKQNEHWHSHNVGTSDTPLWCKGYPGADSPGYDR